MYHLKVKKFTSKILKFKILFGDLLEKILKTLPEDARPSEEEKIVKI
jgi:hypothetical protein